MSGLVFPFESRLHVCPSHNISNPIEMPHLQHETKRCLTKSPRFFRCWDSRSESFENFPFFHAGRLAAAAVGLSTCQAIQPFLVITWFFSASREHVQHPYGHIRRVPGCNPWFMVLRLTRWQLPRNHEISRFLWCLIYWRNEGLTKSWLADSCNTWRDLNSNRRWCTLSPEDSVCYSSFYAIRT